MFFFKSTACAIDDGKPTKSSVIESNSSTFVLRHSVLPTELSKLS